MAIKTDNKSLVKTIVLQPNQRQVADIGKWRNAIRSADRGRVRQLYDLLDDIRLDGVVLDAIDKRIKAVVNADYSFFNAKGEEVDSIIDDIIDKDAFDQLVTELMMAEIQGRSCVELTMSEDGLKVDTIPAQHIYLEEKMIIPDLSNWEKGIKYEGMDHIIVTGQPADYGILVSAAQYAIYKRGGFGDWAQWIELFGMPQRVGKYHANDPEGRRQIIDALSQMGSASFVATPFETEIEVKDTQKGNGNAYDQFRRALNEEILITILGQTLTTIAGTNGARSLGEVHETVEKSKNKADIRYIIRKLNARLVPFLVARGYTEAAGGYFSVPNEVDSTTVSDLVQLSKIIPIPSIYVYNRYGIPKPEDGQEVAGQVQESASGKEIKTPEEPEPKEPKKNKKERKLRFFADALPRLQGYLRNWTTSIRLADYKVGGIDIAPLIQEALRSLYDGEELDAFEQLFMANDTPLQKGLDLAFEDVDDELSEFVDEFKYNTSVFNAFKTHSESKALQDAMLDENGNLRSFSKFKKAVEPILGKYNRVWLQTEYNTAVRAADSARYFQEALRTKHIFPNLEYLESVASNKREDHLEYVGTVLPIEHPWWDEHMPPSAWNCKCSVRKSRKEVTEVPSEEVDDIPAPLRNNPGKSASPFKLKEHPYLKGKGHANCPECRRQGLVGDAELLDYEDLLCPEHRLAYDALRDKRKEQQKLADKIVKEWADVHLPQNGLIKSDNKFYAKKVVLRKSSIKYLLGHIANPKQKLLVMHIEEILGICEPKKGNEFAKLNPTSHNLQKKEQRGAIGFSYYIFDVGGDIYQLDMEVRNGFKGQYETPYSIRKIKKKNS